MSKFSLTFPIVIFLAILTACGGGGNSSSGGNNPPPPTFQLTVTGPASGTGTVTSSPSGINCPGTCSASFAQNTAVTLTAAGATGFGFSGWSGGCSGSSPTCTVTITAATSVAAAFGQLGGLTVSTSGVGSGTIISQPAGIRCPGTCSAQFGNNAQVTLVATPAANNSFGSWSGACSGSGACVVNITSSTAPTVNASFGLTLKSGINHIIFLAQENRSLDHYFGELAEYKRNNGYPNTDFDGLPQFNLPAGTIASNPGCDPTLPYSQPPAPFQDCSYDPAAPVSAYHLQTMCVENPSPSWNESHVDMNYNDPTLYYTGQAALDGFVWTAAHDSRYPIQQNGTTTAQFMDTNGVRVMGYYDGSDLNYYYFMASNFATSDRWFSPVMSRTNPNREYLIAATSYGFAYPNGSNQADNMQIPISTPIIFQELQSANISWKLYVYPDPNPATYGSTNCAANDTRPICLYQISYLHNFAYGQTVLANFPQKIVPISQFYTDAANGTLPAVAQIEPASSIGLDEHAADYDPTPQNPTACCSVQAGAAYVKTLIDAVTGTPAAPSPSWKDSMFILTYDEYGGFYDHVSPTPMPIPDNASSQPVPVDLFSGDVCTSLGGPTCQFQYSGFRVPLIVVSPFTKQNYVSHATADYTAILRLIEDRFNLSPLSTRDANQIHMGDEFLDFVNEPWKTPPANVPAQHTSGPCYLDHLP